MSATTTEFVVITGQSGAGRTQVANAFEDLGWHVIDNMPAELISQIGDIAERKGFERVALVVGPGSEPGNIIPAIDGLRNNSSVQVIFVEATTSVLVRRYESTRRRHPFSQGGRVSQAIEAERQALEPVMGIADLVIDTGDLNVHQLKYRIVDLFGGDSPDAGMRTTVLSFGYKHGHPLDADVVMDCRFLPNPHWVEDLRPKTGLDPAVREYVLGQEIATPFVDQTQGLLDLLMPAYVAEGKSYFTIAFGCTGGHHRSVTIAESIGDHLRAGGYDPAVVHRDIGK
ncbi:MAG: RNase adapter RapZ [Acidimicrobiales bacterium]